MLGALGLDAVEEAAYRHLVGVPSASAESLAATEGAPLSEIRSALSSLEEKGLVARSTATPGDYVASPPAIAVGSMIVERRDEIRRAELELERLVGEYRGAATDRASTEVVDVVHGEQAVAQRFAQLQRGAAHEVLALVKSTVALVSAEDNVDEQVAVSRGVTYRVVVERAAMEKPGFLDLVAESVAGRRAGAGHRRPAAAAADRRSVRRAAAAGADVRRLGCRRVGHPSVRAAGRAGAPLRHGVGVRAGAVAGDRPGGPADRRDRRDGRPAADPAAGRPHRPGDRRSAGDLARTVQRRVSALMARAQVATRFALGHEAARRGWFGV